MTIRIKNLRLRTIIGVNDWERRRKQDVVINVELDFDGRAAAKSDRIEDTVDYKALCKRIIDQVERSRFCLLEKLADSILRIALCDPKVRRVAVEVDKLRALRSADSVSVACQRRRKP
jgi:FolB domain-containing protein